MSDVGSLTLIRGLWDYHWWANRRLYDVALALGEEVAGREVGRQFSFPTLRAMFGHIYGADWLWLQRWKGLTASGLPRADAFPSLAEVGERWEPLLKEQRAFLEALRPADLDRPVEFKSVLFPSEQPYRLPLAPMLMHVPNHATHHRSEVATMLTMLSGSPPDTGLVTYRLIASGQARA